MVLTWQFQLINFFFSKMTDPRVMLEGRVLISSLCPLKIDVTFKITIGFVICDKPLSDLVTIY
jgi:hypothetical protein